MTERRRNLRFDKIFTVYITTADGVARGVGRNISADGLYVEAHEPVPLGARLRITLCGDDGTELTLLCEVRYQVALNYSRADGQEGNTRGMGLRILAYEPMDDRPLLVIDRERLMH